MKTLQLEFQMTDEQWAEFVEHTGGVYPWLTRLCGENGMGELTSLHVKSAENAEGNFEVVSDCGKHGWLPIECTKCGGNYCIECWEDLEMCQRCAENTETEEGGEQLCEEWYKGADL